MDGHRFDDLTRVLGLSLNRKRFVAAVGALLAGPGALQPAAARKRGKKRKARGNGGVGAQGEPGFCEGFCESDADCSSAAGCFCDEETNRCVILTCGGACTKDEECPPLSGCTCILPALRDDVGAEGPILGQCATDTCNGFCTKDADCSDSPGCICDQESGTCVTVLCGGACETAQDCGGPDACLCLLPNGGGDGICTLVCDGSCTKQADCPPIASCVCDTEVGACIAPPTCPGSCTTNPQCAEQGADECVCFLGVDTADAALVERVSTEGGAGECGVCRGAGQSCEATTECCGQLVCEGGPVGASGAIAGGTCRRKPKPGRRCQKHGGSCRRDGDCCAQGSCYKGKCGEKDTHCNNDGECAAGYRCQGGPLAPGHRRCRRNGRRSRNRRNSNGKKR